MKEDGKAAVIACPVCGKIKKFGAWLRPPEHLAKEIESGEVKKIPIICGSCAKKEQ